MALRLDCAVEATWMKCEDPPKKVTKPQQLHLVHGVAVYGSDMSNELAPFTVGKQPARLVSADRFESSGQGRAAARSSRLVTEKVTNKTRTRRGREGRKQQAPAAREQPLTDRPVCLRQNRWQQEQDTRTGTLQQSERPQAGGPHVTKQAHLEKRTARRCEASKRTQTRHCMQSRRRPRRRLLRPQLRLLLLPCTAREQPHGTLHKGPGSGCKRGKEE